jgi:uncharacterized protein YpmS
MGGPYAIGGGDVLLKIDLFSVGALRAPRAPVLSVRP